MRQLAAAVFVVGLFAQPHQKAPAPAAPPEWLNRVSSWVEAVNEHKPGSLDMAARLVGFWTDRDLDEVRADYLNLVAICKRELGRSARPAPVVYKDTKVAFPDLLKLLDLTQDEAKRGNANRLLLRAAMLHADIAMQVIPLLPGRIGCSARGTLLVQDGSSIGMGCVCIHWTMGRALLDAVRPDPGKDPTVRLWYHATITYLLGTGDFANAEFHIPHGQFLFPGDAAILFEHGRYHEAFASPFIQTAALESGSDRRGAKVHLEEAADHYRKALRENPLFVEARVHRGFVLEELGRYDDAAEELGRAVNEAQGPQLRYYAELFLGRAEESIGNAVAARDHYRRASELYPQAQSPHLSLTLLARQRGDRTGAMEAMRKVLALPHTDREHTDPWWDYYHWQNEQSGALLADLYRRVLPEGPR